MNEVSKEVYKIKWGCCHENYILYETFTKNKRWVKVNSFIHQQKTNGPVFTGVKSNDAIGLKNFDFCTDWVRYLDVETVCQL